MPTFTTSFHLLLAVARASHAHATALHIGGSHAIYTRLWCGKTTSGLTTQVHGATHEKVQHGLIGGETLPKESFANTLQQVQLARSSVSRQGGNHLDSPGKALCHRPHCGECANAYVTIMFYDLLKMCPLQRRISGLPDMAFLSVASSHLCCDVVAS